MLKMKQADLAKAANISTAALNSIELGGDPTGSDLSIHPACTRGCGRGFHPRKRRRRWRAAADALISGVPPRRERLATPNLERAQ
jgi:hypothetical protein